MFCVKLNFTFEKILFEHKIGLLKMEQISVEQLHEKIQSGEDICVLDVREQEEYDESNMGARLWPLSKLRQMDADGIEDWKQKEIIVHCHSGKRSLQACMLLETLGFLNVSNLVGGIAEWQEKYGDEKVG